LELILDHWQSIASVIGLIVTVIGFYVAFYQISKTADAVEAASRAVAETKDSMTKNLVLIAV
jgi:biopolymer transport protein ExbB/TolQ